jgi:uncharacterized protein with PQ loop repeat
VTTQQLLPLLAAAAGLVMGLAPLLQAMRALRRRRADDVSAAWLAVIVGGALAWLAYGLSLANWAIIVPNAAGSIASAFTLLIVMSIRRRARARRVT